METGSTLKKRLEDAGLDPRWAAPIQGASTDRRTRSGSTSRNFGPGKKYRMEVAFRPDEDHFDIHETTNGRSEHIASFTISDDGSIQVTFKR